MNLLEHKFPPELRTIYTEELANQLANTQGAIGSLNLLDRVLHNPDLLMHPLLGKEAESSARLEGTQSTIDDAYKIDIMEQTEHEKNEAYEIRNYEEAMYTGLKIIKKYPLNKLAMREIHKVLLNGVRGRDKHPGEFRKDDAWIGEDGTKKGDARYVAPDAAQLPGLLDQLEKYISHYGSVHPLIVAGVIHHRFEAIHPFEDGNGRTGRLLISLFLIKNNLLKLPILYPSGYFEKNKSKYMDALAEVDNNENWYAWLLFYLKGLEEQARLSIEIGQSIDNLFKKSKSLISKENANLGLIRVLEYMFEKYYVTAPIVHKATDIPLTTCKRYLETLADDKVIVDLGIHNRQRVFGNIKLLDILRNI
jgi:Fic family protein